MMQGLEAGAAEVQLPVHVPRLLVAERTWQSALPPSPDVVPLSAGEALSCVAEVDAGRGTAAMRLAPGPTTSRFQCQVGRVRTCAVVCTVGWGPSAAQSVLVAQRAHVVNPWSVWLGRPHGAASGVRPAHVGRVHLTGTGWAGVCVCVCVCGGGVWGLGV